MSPTGSKRTGSKRTQNERPQASAVVKIAMSSAISSHSSPFVRRNTNLSQFAKVNVTPFRANQLTHWFTHHTNMAGISSFSFP